MWVWQRMKKVNGWPRTILLNTDGALGITWSIGVLGTLEAFGMLGAAKNRSFSTSTPTLTKAWLSGYSVHLVVEELDSARESKTWI